MKKFCLIIVSAILFLSAVISVRAQTATPTPTGSSQAASDLQAKIADLQAKIADLQSQEKTLSSQIAVYDSQINLTELRIQSTKQQINELNLDIDTASKKIVNVEKSLDNLTKVLINRIIATYEIGTTSRFQTLIASSDFSDFVKRANYLRLAQAHDKKLLYDTVQAKNDYANQKNIYQEQKVDAEQLRVDLENYQSQLDQEKRAKADLLAQTQGSEANYQKLLAQAQAEYQAIVGIIAGKGTENEVRQVNQGDVIASVIQGASCNSSGTHLHFTVSQGGSALNPFNFLRPVDYVNESGGDPFNPSGSWDWPISPTIQFNQGFGETWYVRTYHFYPTHNGIDIMGSSSSVRAVKSGTLFRGSYSGYQGCTLPYVRVHHNDDGLDTFYLHVYSN